jgi:hypothetical protein
MRARYAFLYRILFLVADVSQVLASASAILAKRNTPKK